MKPETDLLREARDALCLFREAFVIAVGDKSPFAKQALKQADIVTAALASAEPAALEREGWKLVPIEPTEEMETAAKRYVRHYHDIADLEWFSKVPKDFFRLAYRTMLSAAPPPPPPATLGEPQAADADRMREALLAIKLRCTMGDPKFDWRETLANIATAALHPQQPATGGKRKE